MNRLQRLVQKKPRIVAGLMSGTSLDGVDAVVARLDGNGKDLHIEQLSFVCCPYPDELREIVLLNSTPETSSVKAISQLNVRLAHEYARAVRFALERAEIGLDSLDLVGCHGQTIHHVPVDEPCAGMRVVSTLQIGDPSVLANLLGVPVMGDFRLADMALGGQGAPLVPYFDYVYFGHPEEQRGLLNIGGIANLTVLPRGATQEQVYAFDTGPGNMVIDALARIYFGASYDEGGRLAAAGNIVERVVTELLLDEYFTMPPPKSTGRELYGMKFVDRLISMVELAQTGATGNDLVATATALTAYGIYSSYARFVRDRHPLDKLIVSGGGKHNTFLMDLLQRCFNPIPVESVDRYGLDSDAKEALCFGVLAHEAVDGVPTSMPGVTGALRSTILGKLCIPY